MSDTTNTVTYEAKHDQVGALVALQNRRRFVVVKYRNGKFAYVCGQFASAKAAEKRAAYLNANRIVLPSGKVL